MYSTLVIMEWQIPLLTEFDIHYKLESVVSILTYLSSLALNPVELAPAPSLSIRLITPRIFPSGSLIAMHMKLFSESSVLVKLMVLPVWATCPANFTLYGTGCLFDNCCWKIEINKSFGSGGNCLGTRSRISSRDSVFENFQFKIWIVASVANGLVYIID